MARSGCGRSTTWTTEAALRRPAGGRPQRGQYAGRHDPFVYFHSIIDSPACARNVVDLGMLPETSPRGEHARLLVHRPDLCADGHDWPAPTATSPGGYAGINAFLQEWVPRIKASPAYQDRGMILVTFDECETAEACCGETSGPNTDNNGAGRPATAAAGSARSCSRPASRPARCRSPPTTTTRTCAGSRTTSASRDLANASAGGVRSAPTSSAGRTAPVGEPALAHRAEAPHGRASPPD